MMLASSSWSTSNVMGRSPEPEGYAFWLGRLQAGSITRGGVLLMFSESPEYVAITHTTPPLAGYFKLLPAEPLNCGAGTGVTVARVTRVVDGDTLDVSTGQRVRVVGIDTPELGDCGASDARARLSALTLNREVLLTPGARDDRDRYGRLLRYVDVRNLGNQDAGLTLIQDGLAVARYDSRDGYGAHPREADYVAADAATGNVCGWNPNPASPDPRPDPTACG